MKTAFKIAAVAAVLLSAQSALAAEMKHPAPTPRPYSTDYESTSPSADYRYYNSNNQRDWNNTSNRGAYRNSRSNNTFWGYKVDTYHTPEELNEATRAVHHSH